MDRRLLFPAIAATAWAQQVSPATAEAEKAVRVRAEKFLQLEQDKNFRAAWALVANDTQDYFFNSGRPDIESFVVEKIELSDNNTRARVTFKVKATLRAPGVGSQAFEFPGTSTWKIENGDWYWYVDQSVVDTPFGKVTAPHAASGGSARLVPPVIPNLAALQNKISIDKTSVVLSDAEPMQSVKISNDMPGSIGLEVTSGEIEGVTVELEKKQVNAGEAAELRFRVTGNSKASGTVRVTCSPLGKQFDIHVTAN
jgi:hypothetical protein